MAKEKIRILQANTTQRKTFSYKLGDTNLEFTLRVDIKQELKDFKELLTRATAEVEAEIKKL